MSVNDRQVGGEHYRSELQHWDLIERNGIGYLEAAATKYVTRWRKKNGVQDLEKAVHYVEKLMELNKEGVRQARGRVPPDQLELFQTANKLTNAEALVVHLLCTWREPSELGHARAMMEALIEGAKARVEPKVVMR